MQSFCDEGRGHPFTRFDAALGQLTISYKATVQRAPVTMPAELT